MARPSGWGVGFEIQRSWIQILPPLGQVSVQLAYFEPHIAKQC